MALLRFLLVLVAALVAALATNTAPAEGEVVEEDHFFKKYFHKPGFDYPKPHPFFKKLHKPHPFFKKYLHKPHPFFKKPFPFLHTPPVKPPSEKVVKPDFHFHKKLFPKYKVGFGRYHPGNPPADKP